MRSFASYRSGYDFGEVFTRQGLYWSGCNEVTVKSLCLPPPHNTRVRQPHTDSAQVPLNRARHVHDPLPLDPLRSSHGRRSVNVQSLPSWRAVNGLDFPEVGDADS